MVARAVRVSRWARTAASNGESVSSPRPGDIAVFWRTSPASGNGHVGFVLETSDQGVTILGGNQRDAGSGDAVSVKVMSRAQLLGFRRPAAA